jgi:hypothetical protein
MGLQMTSAVFEFSVPVFERHLKLLSKLLETAETYAKDREIEPTLLVFSRLYPDMFTLAEQIRAACNTAKRSTARLAGLRLPESQNTGQSFADLQRRIDDALAYLEALPESRFAKPEGRKIEFPFGSGVVMVTPQQYLGSRCLTSTSTSRRPTTFFGIRACQSASAIFLDRWRTLPILRHDGGFGCGFGCGFAFASLRH